MKTKYLIIGNSAGGIGAAEAIREVDKTGSLVMVSDEPYPAYSRPLISKLLARENTLEEMLFRPQSFYLENNIVSLSGKRVKSLNLESHIAELDSGERMDWEKLLLATGGMPIVPKIGGRNKKGVFTFTTVDDAKAIDAFLDKARKAVVIGGGLIGISVTEALVKRGIEVIVVEMKERVLNTILDEQASLMAEEILKQAGVEVITNHTVAEMRGEENVKGVVLNDGREIPCDLVVLAIGVVPHTELVTGSKIKVNRGIVVDSHMATSYPDVYSCGDAAEAYDFVYGTSRLAPVWPNAYMGGRIAGYNMAGVTTEYPGGTAMNSLNYFGLDIAAAGIVVPPDEEGFEILSRQNNGVYCRVILKDDRVMGMVFVRDIEKSGIVFGLMKERINVGAFKQELVAGDFGLACLPQELRKRELGIASTGSLSQPADGTRTEEDSAGE